MFDRLSDDARSAVVGAREEAIRVGHPRVGPEHILIALLRRSDDVPARALSRFGVDASAAQAAATEMLGRGNKGANSSEASFSSASKKVLELGLHVALSLGHDSIESGHILIALLDAEPSPASEILTRLGVDLLATRTEAVALLGSSFREREQTQRNEMAPDSTLKVRQGRPFGAAPDSRLRRVMLAAARRVEAQERKEFGIDDVLGVIDEPTGGEEPPGGLAD